VLAIASGAIGSTFRLDIGGKAQHGALYLGVVGD
jgi:hypothetical protein